jgi:hypothetical protein
VCLLKALYGLKQAPRLCYQHINSLLKSLGFVESTADPNLYIKRGILIFPYADDLLIAYCKEANHNAKEIKQQLNQQYRMIDLGTARQFLGPEITHNSDGSILLSQQKYIETVIKRFRMESAHGCVSLMDPNIKLENEQCEDNPADKRLFNQLLAYSCMEH